MTVHMIEVVASDDVDDQKAKNKIANLKSKYGEKLKKQNAPFDLTETLDGTTFYRGRFRVTLSDKEKEKKDLTEQIEKELDKSASWWRVKYHECDHDENQKTGCSWEYENSAGTIPEGV